MSQQSKAAVRPDVFASFSDIDKRTLEEKQKELDSEDIALSRLAGHDGWRVLNEYIDFLKREMDNLVAELISSGGSFEDVGRVTVVANLAKEKLYAIQKRVQDARDATSGSGVSATE